MDDSEHEKMIGKIDVFFIILNVLIFSVALAIIYFGVPFKLTSELLEIMKFNKILEIVSVLGYVVTAKKIKSNQDESKLNTLIIAKIIWGTLFSISTISAMCVIISF